MTNKYIKTDREGWVKDPQSGAVLSTDTEGRKAYEKMKERMAKTQDLENRMNKVETKLNRITHLLEQLVKNK